MNCKSPTWVFHTYFSLKAPFPEDLTVVWLCPPSLCCQCWGWILKIPLSRAPPLCFVTCHSVLYFFFFNFILFMAVLGLRFCARAFSSCGKRGPPFIAVRGPLTIAASLVVEHRLQMRRLSNCGSRAQLLRGMWDPPRPGLEPVSPAPAGRLSTTAPPGKPLSSIF